MPEYDAGVAPLDNGKARWSPEELIEQKARDVAIDLCCRKHVLDEKVRNHVLRCALLGWGQSKLAEGAGVSIITVKRLEAADEDIQAHFANRHVGHGRV